VNPRKRAPITVREVRRSDHDRWRHLYSGYAAFYQVDQSDHDAETVWRWIHDHDHEVQALVAEDSTGTLVGLAHYRAFARPLSASIGCFLDDLYVDPSARGGGAVDALLTALQQLSKERGWTVVRWITAADNERAQAAYARYAQRTTWLTYDMTPPEAGASS